MSHNSDFRVDVIITGNAMSQRILHLIIASIVFGATIAFSQTCSIIDSSHDESPEMPRWTDIVRVTATQEGQSLLLELEMADSIPRFIQDSCLFQLFLRVDTTRVNGVHSEVIPADFLIESNLRNWDGGWWHATLMLKLSDTTAATVTKAQLHDWKLAGSRLRVKFSLISLPWQRIAFRAGVLYRDRYADLAPDIGTAELLVDRRDISGLERRTMGRVQFLYPTAFDSIVTRYCVLEMINLAYALERELTGVLPLGGDSVRFAFDPFIGGAALEGDPITVGPYMWGKNPPWFVYFHEMGHNFCNAASRFRQMYPLLPFRGLGPLPAHLLFYEAFASLPAMYVYDKLSSSEGPKSQLQADALASLEAEWQSTRKRFESAWQAYKTNPAFEKLNPDIVDGLFLELQGKFGWDMMRRLYFCLRPEGLPLSILSEALPADTPDLRRTRATFTAALLSAAATTDLQRQFVEWGFPIDDSLFSRAYRTLSSLLDPLKSNDGK